jgi:protein-L-isoaspartate(D-aspartate) O-methyltransferase
LLSTSRRGWTIATKFVAWGVAQRGEDPKFLGERFDRFGAMVRNEDLVNDRNKHAFLLMPREKFVLQQNLSHAYEHAFLDIGFGATISGPHIVGRMTSNIDVKLGERVLEIGTGSGYQSAYLAHLTNQALRTAGVALPPIVRDAAAS